MLRPQEEHTHSNGGQKRVIHTHVIKFPFLDLDGIAWAYFVFVLKNWLDGQF